MRPAINRKVGGNNYLTRVVLDTNVLVSALWTPVGNCSTIVSLILADRIVPCLNHQIIDEYRVVLSRPRLAFPRGQTEEFLKEIADRGLMVTITSPSTFSMTDEADRKFYDTARACKAFLVTGNVRHYPKDPLVITPAQFLSRF